MYLQAPTAHLSNIINGVAAGTLVGVQQLAGGGGNAGGLRLVSCKEPADRQPIEYVGTNASLSALINAAGRSIAVPAAIAPCWLEVPQSWVPAMLATLSGNCPSAGPLQMTSECAVDAQAGWAALLQSLGWTSINPSVFPVPVLNA